MMAFANDHIPDGLWDSLIFEDEVKTSLFRYVSAIMLFSDRCVDPHLVTLQKLVLLHGPPGTGKTSLCRCATLLRMSCRVRAD